MHTNRRKHRHFIVAPLALMALLVSSWPAFTGGLASVQASLTQQTEVGTVYALSNGSTALALEGAEMRVEEGKAVLVNGSVLVSGAGLLELEVQGNRVLALNGAMHVTRYGDDITVAALSTPVLLSDGRATVVVPAHRQWRVQGTLPLASNRYTQWMYDTAGSPLPNSFLERQLALLRTLPDFSVEGLLSDPWLDMPIDYSMLLLPAARERKAAEDAEKLLSSLQLAVESGNAEEVTALVETYPGAFHSARAREVAALLLGMNSAKAAIATPLAQILLGDEDLQVLSALHPLTREITWTFGADYLDATQRQLLWHLVPATDFAEEQAGPLVMQRWQQLVQSDLQERGAASDLLSTLIERLERTRGDLRKQNYPSRVELLSQAMVELAAEYEQSLSPRALEIVSAIHAEEDVSLAPIDLNHITVYGEEEVPTEETVQPAERLGGYPPEDVERIANEVLEQFGALLTEQTTVVAVDPFTAEIENVRFGDGATKTLSFSLDVETKQVSGIYDGSKEYPLTLNFADFLPWARK